MVNDSALKLFNDEQYRNAYAPRDVKTGTSMLSRLVQYSNAYESIDFIDGTATLTRPAQYQNTYELTVVRIGAVNVVKFVQFWNAYVPIDVIGLTALNSVKLVHPSNI